MRDVEHRIENLKGVCRQSPRYHLLPQPPPHLTNKSVCLARDEMGAGESVLIKSHPLPIAAAEDADVLLELAEAYLSLSHPNIAAPIDVLIEKQRGIVQTVVSYVPGKEFLPTMRDLQLDHFFDIIIQLCRVLHYLHVRNYAHLDLHPGNLLLIPPLDASSSWTLKLIDIPFVPLDHLRENRDALSYNFAYSAPEVTSGGDFDHRADLYSLGVLLFSALCPSNIVTSTRTAGFITAEQLENLTPDFFGPIAKRLLQVDPDKRYSSIYFLLEDLRTHIKTCSTSLDTSASLGTTLSLPRLVKTSSSSSCIAAIKTSLSESQNHSAQTLIIQGLPSSGIERLQLHVGRYLRIHGFRTARINNRADSALHLLIDELNSPEQQTQASPEPPLKTALLCRANDLEAVDNYLPALTNNGNRLIVVATMSYDLDANRKFLQSFTHLPRTTAIDVKRISDQEASHFLDALLLPNALSQPDKESIAALGFRLPGLIIAQVLFLIQQNLLIRQGAPWILRVDNTQSLPIAPLVSARFLTLVQSLSETELTILKLLSLSPIPTHASILADVLETEASALLQVLGRLVSNSLLQEQSESYSLNAPLIRMILQPMTKTASFSALASRSLLNLQKAHSDRTYLDIPLSTHLAIAAGHPEIALESAKAVAAKLDIENRPTEALHYYRIALELIPTAQLPHFSHIISNALRILGRLGNHHDFFQYARLLEASAANEPQYERATHYSLLARHHIDVGHFEDASRLAEEAYQLSHQKANYEARASALASLAWIKFRKGQHSAAMQLAHDSISLYRKLQNSDEIRLPLTTIAGAYYLMGDYQRALSSEEEVLSIVRGHNIPIKTVQSTINLGVLYMESGNLDAAQKSFTDALMISKRHKFAPPAINAHSNLVMFHQYDGDLFKATAHYHYALGLVNPAGDQHVRNHLSLSQADNFVLAGHFDSALEFLSAVQRFARLFEDSFADLVSDLQKSILLTHIGCFQRAYDLLVDLLPRLEVSQFLVYQSYAGLALCEVLHKLGRFEESQHWLCWVENKMPRQNAVCRIGYWLACGGLRRGSDDLTSIRFFALSASRARKWGYRRFLFEAWLCLAQTYLAVGKVEEAGMVLKKLVGLHERIKLRLFEPWLFLAMGDYAAAVGEEIESKKHLLNARTSLMELAYNISDADLRRHYLNRPDSRGLLSRSEDLEDLVYEGFPSPPESPQATRALESIARINEQLHRRDSLKSTLSLIIDEAIRLSSAERGIVFLFNASGREELKVSRNIGRRSLVDARKYTRTALQRIRHGEIVFAADTVTDPQFNSAESITQLRIRSVTCVPLRSRGSIIGALYLDSRRPRLAASQDLLKSLEIFAQQAAAALERAIRFFNLAEENQRLRETALIGVPALIGQGTYFAGLKKLIAAAGSTDLPVLILGESGTGKELVARAIHYSGKRGTEPFLSVDCGALPENLVESELFGYRRGAFTGAHADKEGLFVAARGGTLFLDEIGNTTPNLQAKLLRAIQEREIRPLGATEPIAFQARIVAATNRDLRREARDGRFRQDLLFRLNGMTIELPALRDRKGEIPLLINHFLRKTRGRYGHRIQGISDEAVMALTRFDWPGNIRELENSIERAVALAQEGTIMLKDLPDTVRSASVVGWSEKRGEHRLIEEALLRFAGDKSRAADYIGWNRQKLYRKMEQYNIPIDFGRRNTA